MSRLKIISGGQTGVDRAALDAARELGMPYGGHVPKGRWTEEGPLPDRYEGMLETEGRHPAGRTKHNVRDSDATLIITRGNCEGGTLLTLQKARAWGQAQPRHRSRRDRAGRGCCLDPRVARRHACGNAQRRGAAREQRSIDLC